ncbi:aspartate/tyrosine/aromatic aminotransferase [Bernardetia litoralis DSM 6794]|uniref:Aspartate/tyrosine/aromatic aminotransferase n=1 Tax=Bernardetia litoralis (strain ATCC 23117 / DSM 6794 / NBRC 15988 / NCIMB 1366 / Fx l1 / Sio-4) TaxID=880071 RepID=I4AG51_BERLS|nr:methionine aminotransferase [Bernardetia litoralis]AFM02936.1 aspartate/tyrosine/aromatic aminotransferase [Bernardetia litoralis DSM 6794]
MITTKLPKVGTTIFSVMSALAQKHNAINLSQGFPDFPVDKKLTEEVTKAMNSNFNQYAPMAGFMPLREQIAQKTEKIYGISPNPDTEITVLSGASEGIFAAITATVRENDEVIIFEPAYDLYVPAIELQGGIVRYISLSTSSFRPDFEKLKRLISAKTRLIIFNTPHNPTGTTWTNEDLKTLDSLLEGSRILVLSDEVYEHLVFDNQKHQSVLSYPNLRKRSFAVFSFGKTFHATGWKVGYVIAPKELTAELRKIHQYITFSTVTPIQVGLSEFLKNEENYIHLADFYQQKRDYLCKLLAQTNFSFAPTQGTYFQLIDYSKISDQKDTDFAIWLTEKIGVASIPISPFYQNLSNSSAKILRICFAKNNKTLEKAIEKLSRL